MDMGAFRRPLALVRARARARKLLRKFTRVESALIDDTARLETTAAMTAAAMPTTRWQPTCAMLIEHSHHRLPLGKWTRDILAERSPVARVRARFAFGGARRHRISHLGRRTICSRPAGAFNKEERHFGPYAF